MSDSTGGETKAAQVRIAALLAQIDGMRQEMDKFASAAGKSEQRAVTAERLAAGSVVAAEAVKAQIIQDRRVADEERDKDRRRDQAKMASMQRKIEGLMAGSATIDGVTLDGWRQRALDAEARADDSLILSMLRDGAAIGRRRGAKAKTADAEGMPLADWIEWAEARVKEKKKAPKA